MDKVYVAMSESNWSYSDDGRDSTIIIGVFETQEEAEKYINNYISQHIYCDPDFEDRGAYYHIDWGDYETYFIEVWPIGGGLAKSSDIIRKKEWEF